MLEGLCVRSGFMDIFGMNIVELASWIIVIAALICLNLLPVIVVCGGVFGIMYLVVHFFPFVSCAALCIGGFYYLCVIASKSESFLEACCRVLYHILFLGSCIIPIRFSYIISENIGNPMLEALCGLCFLALVPLLSSWLLLNPIFEYICPTVFSKIKKDSSNKKSLNSQDSD